MTERKRKPTTADHEGNCYKCSTFIKPGDPITWARTGEHKGQWYHIDCMCPRGHPQPKREDYDRDWKRDHPGEVKGDYNPITPDNVPEQPDTDRDKVNKAHDQAVKAAKQETQDARESRDNAYNKADEETQKRMEQEARHRQEEHDLNDTAKNNGTERWAMHYVDPTTRRQLGGDPFFTVAGSKFALEVCRDHVLLADRHDHQVRLEGQRPFGVRRRVGHLGQLRHPLREIAELVRRDDLVTGPDREQNLRRARRIGNDLPRRLIQRDGRSARIRKREREHGRRDFDRRSLTVTRGSVVVRSARRRDQPDRQEQRQQPSRTRPQPLASQPLSLQQPTLHFWSWRRRPARSSCGEQKTPPRRERGGNRW